MNTVATPIDTSEGVVQLAISALVPSLTNRKGFVPAALEEMADTIRARGVRFPIIARPLPGARMRETRLQTPAGRPLPTHEIVCGERRFLASQIAGAKTIPVIVRNLDDGQALEEQVIENVQREAYTELEEGEAFKRLMQHPDTHMTAEAVGKSVGRSRRHVFNRVKLLDLRAEAREALITGQIDATRGVLLAGISDHQLQIKALAGLTERDYAGDWKISTRKAAEYIEREFMLKIGGAKFKTADAELLPEAGSCTTCVKRTGNNPDLFADVKSADVCTDPPCFHRKEEAHNNAILRLAHENGQEVITGREAKALMPNSFGGVEGYLRLDDAADSPTDKPLRKLLGNVLEREEVKATLIANPHNKGEMIAVLPSAKVAELLKARGRGPASEAVDAQIEKDAAAKADNEKRLKTIAFEQAWRNKLLKDTWAMVEAAQPGEVDLLSDKVLQYLALNLAESLNAERTRQLCKMLDLGKIAPTAALQDYIKAQSRPKKILLLLVMYRGIEFKQWSDDALKDSAALLMVAADFDVSVDAAKAAAKKEMRAKTADVESPSPQLRISGEGGPARKTSKTSPARKPKISAEEASSGIAAAMQGIEASTLVDAGEPAPSPSTSVDADQTHETDALMARALALVIREQKASVRLLKSELGIGHDRARQVLDQLEAAGKISACSERGARTVLVSA